MKPLRILILGTGGMAKTHAEAYATIEGVSVVAGVDIYPDNVRNFCDRHGIENRFASLDDAIAWGQFDAVSNVTPDQLHYTTTMPLLAAGKHVLCEKPLATNFEHARILAETATRAGVVNMINLSYRNVAVLQHAAKLVEDGIIGGCRHFEASYLQSWLTQPSWGDWRTQPTWLWRLSTRHGSKGVLGDVGIHILDFACLVAGSLPREVSCRLKTFPKADGDQIGEFTLDANDSCAMHLEMDNGSIGVISATRYATGHHNDLRLRIYGELGGLDIGFEKNVGTLRICVGEDILTETWREIETGPVKSVYERFVEAIRDGGEMMPSFDRGAALQRVLDCAEHSNGGDGRSIVVHV